MSETLLGREFLREVAAANIAELASSNDGNVLKGYSDEWFEARNLDPDFFREFFFTHALSQTMNVDSILSLIRTMFRVGWMACEMAQVVSDE